jgi:hypothetical protein
VADVFSGVAYSASTDSIYACYQVDTGEPRGMVYKFDLDGQVIGSTDIPSVVPSFGNGGGPTLLACGLTKLYVYWQDHDLTDVSTPIDIVIRLLASTLAYETMSVTIANSGIGKDMAASGPDYHVISQRRGPVAPSDSMVFAEYGTVTARAFVTAEAGSLFYDGQGRIWCNAVQDGEVVFFRYGTGGFISDTITTSNLNASTKRALWMSLL